MTSEPARRETVFVRGVELARLSKPELARYAGTLDEQERARALALPPEGRSAYVAAHGVKRVLLAHLAGLSAAAWRFRSSCDGKPSVVAAQDRGGLVFSISHTRAYVVVAAGFGCALGIDIEAVNRSVDPLAFARRYFAPSETAQLRAMAPQAARWHFFGLWTAKEAVLKALGCGLRRDPRTIEIAALSAERWSFATWRPTSLHVATVAFRPQP